MNSNRREPRRPPKANDRSQDVSPPKSPPLLSDPLDAGGPERIPLRHQPDEGRRMSEQPCSRGDRRAGQQGHHCVRCRPHRPAGLRQMPPPQGMSGFLGTDTHNTPSCNGLVPITPLGTLTNQTSPRGAYKLLAHHGQGDREEPSRRSLTDRAQAE